LKSDLLRISDAVNLFQSETSLTQCHTETCYEAIHHHHSVEEEYFFPWIEEYSGEKGIMEVNIEQHKAFEAGVEKFKEYVFSVTPETYNVEQLKGIIDEFGPALAVHLSDEIQTLLSLDKYGGDKLAKTWGKLDKKAIESIEDNVGPF
jgi:hypothetical protein